LTNPNIVDFNDGGMFEVVTSELNLSLF
jgi:hypothetical protein